MISFFITFKGTLRAYISCESQDPLSHEAAGTVRYRDAPSGQGLTDDSQRAHELRLQIDRFRKAEDAVIMNTLESNR